MNLYEEILGIYFLSLLATVAYFASPWPWCLLLLVPIVILNVLMYKAARFAQGVIHRVSEVRTDVEEIKSGLLLDLKRREYELRRKNKKDRQE